MVWLLTCCMAYADDMVVLAPSWRALQTLLVAIEDAADRVFIQYQRVTDRQTDRRTVGQNCYINIARQQQYADAR